MSFCEACEAPYPVPMKHTCGKDGFWFTVDSLAAALHTPPLCKWHDHDVSEHRDRATAIIQAAKEDERE